MLKDILLALLIAIVILVASGESYKAGEKQSLEVVDYLHQEINQIIDEYEYQLDILTMELKDANYHVHGDQETLPFCPSHWVEENRIKHIFNM